MPISIENLSTEARQAVEGRVPGSTIVHFDIAFTFDGTANTFNLDDWINPRFLC